MTDTKRSSWPSSSMIVTLIFVLLCLGEFIRVELLLKEHVTRIRDLESKVGNGNQDQNVSPTKSDTSRGRARRSAVSGLKLTDLVKLQQLHASVCNVTITDKKCRTGLPGPPGKPGPRGRSGWRGPKGEMGIPGKHGYHGNPGPAGPRGEKGERGERGSMGMPGLHGTNGIMGPRGPRGEKGDKGEMGVKGERGEKGEQAPKGTQLFPASPTVNVSPATLVINEGLTAIFNCSVRAFPQPVIGWSKEGSISVLTRNSKLMIANVRPSDRGAYQCQAKNSHGTGRKTVYLAVNYFTDCAEIYKSGERRNGVYKVDPDGHGPFRVYCDMTTDQGGWTVFQRRKDGSVDFYRDWNQYRKGFGNLNGEFWLGNDKINRLSTRTASVLRIDLEDWDGVKAYAKYGSFSVGARSTGYKLTATSYSGTAGDSINKVHNGRRFSTKDVDNDSTWRASCAKNFLGAWWYQSCYDSNLNGKYLGNVRDRKGVVWYKFKNQPQSLKFTEMKVKPVPSRRISG